MKKCTGCGRIDNEPLGLNKYGEPFLACCPDNNYVEMKQKTAMIKLNIENNLTVKSNGKVMIIRSIELIGTNTKLPVQIIADFSNIPSELHDEYLRTLCYQYNSDVRVYSNIGKSPIDWIALK